MASVTASSGPRATMRTIAATLILLLSFLVLAATPARADCDVLDVTCVVETVDDTTDEVVETVDEVVETVEGTVDEVVETVEGTVDEVVETVEGTVDEVVDEVEGTIDPIAPPQPTPGENPPGQDPRPENGTSVVRPDAGGGSGSLVDPALLAASGPLGPVGFIGDAVPTSPQGLFGPLAGAAADLAKTLAFPLALIVLVFGFVTVQNRLDRKDPKLALAAATPDVLNFA